MHRPARLTLASAVALATVVATTAATSRTSGPEASARPADVTSRTQAAAEPVVLAFGGDVHFEGAIERELDRNPRLVLSSIGPVLRSADLAVVNLETAITTRGTPAPKEYAFRAPAKAFAALRAGGVDVASLANNHGLDYGVAGLRDSLAAARRYRFPVVGIGRNDTEAYRPFRRTVNGRRIAVIGATQVLDDHLISSWTAGPGKPGMASAKDVPRLLRAVREARASADTVVVYLHWGVEAERCPGSTQRTLARQLVGAGADVVVGGHSHRVQGAGRLRGALVAYGLGNFVWYATSGPSTETGVLLVTVDGRRVLRYRWEPARIVDGTPRPVRGAERRQALASWRSLRGCTGLKP